MILFLLPFAGGFCGVLVAALLFYALDNVGRRNPAQQNYRELNDMFEKDRENMKRDPAHENATDQIKGW